MIEYSQEATWAILDRRDFDGFTRCFAEFVCTTETEDRSRLLSQVSRAYSYEAIATEMQFRNLWSGLATGFLLDCLSEYPSMFFDYATRTTRIQWVEAPTKRDLDWWKTTAPLCMYQSLLEDTAKIMRLLRIF